MIFDMTRSSSGGGGGPSASDAILIVTVPTGSTVTATKGSVTLTPTLWTAAADASLDCALFVIPPAQFDSTTPWTVTATRGTETASYPVTIDSNKQYDVELYYKLYIISGGTTPYNWKLLSGMTMTKNASSVVFKGSGSGYHVGVVDGLFDVTAYKLLIADVTFSVVDNGAYNALWDANVATPTKDNTSAIVYANNSGHLELDISGFSGSMKIGVGTVYTNVSTYTSLYLMT